MPKINSWLNAKRSSRMTQEPPKVTSLETFQGKKMESKSSEKKSIQILKKTYSDKLMGQISSSSREDGGSSSPLRRKDS